MPATATQQNVVQMTRPLVLHEMPNSLARTRRRQNAAEGRLIRSLQQRFDGRATRLRFDLQTADDLVDGLFRHQSVGRELAAGDVPPARFRATNLMRARYIGGRSVGICDERTYASPRADDV